MDRLKALAVFKAVADHGSFARAASALDLSPAAVTRTVQELEALLAVRLLQRTTRRIALTPVGHEVLGRAQGLLESYDELSTMSSLNAAVAAGRVRLVAPAWLGRRCLGRTIAAYLASCPQVSLELRLRSGDADALDEEADLALCADGELKPSMIARRVAELGVGVYASPDYLARRGAPLHPAQLAQHDCLSSSSVRGSAAWQFHGAAGGDALSVPVKGALSANHPEALLDAAVHGIGVALLPEVLAQEAVDAGLLRRLLPGWRAAPLTLHLVYGSRRHLPMSVRRLIEHLCEGFAAMAQDNGEVAATAALGAATQRGSAGTPVNLRALETRPVAPAATPLPRQAPHARAQTQPRAAERALLLAA